MGSGRGRTAAAAAAEPDSDEDDYVFYGTKLYDEEGLATGTVPTGSRPDPTTTRSLPVHQQVATDEQGRKRFHGAFTGGFSAGYYNTVGSKVRVVQIRLHLL
jgi:G patch domain-containing protein 1